MRRSSILPLLPLHRPLTSSLYDKSPFTKSSFMWIQIMHKTSGGRRPKKKIYHRVHELDNAMDLQKKPNVILNLKSIIQSQKNQSLLLRDLEKEVGFIEKWNFIAVFLKEGYEGSRLVDKCPLLMFRDKFLALSGRRDNIYHVLYEHKFINFYRHLCYVFINIFRKNAIKNQKLKMPKQKEKKNDRTIVRISFVHYFGKEAYTCKYRSVES